MALRSRTAGQAVTFAAANGLTSLFSAVAMALLARGLSAPEFGSFSFCVTFLLFLSLFFDFGLFLPAARLTAKADRPGQRHLVGAALIAYVPVGLAFCIVVAALALAVDSVFAVEARDALLIGAPLAIVYPFQLLAWHLGQGLDRLHVYSITLAAGNGLFVVFLLGCIVLDVELSIVLGIVLRGAGFLVGCVAFVVWAGPVFRRATSRVGELVRDARDYGFQVYLGRALSTATYNMDVLLLGALANAEVVGFYAVAVALGNVIGLPALGLSAALFPRMTGQSRLNRRWLTVSWVVALAGAGLLVLTAEPVIEVLFSERYLSAADIVPPLALASAVRSVTSVYNSFLSAHGRGRELRNAALVLAGTNLVLNLVLIPPFEAQGAAWASLIALLANLGAHILFYRRSLSG